MAINERVITGTTAVADGDAASVEQNLILHLDANDVDSYDGDGSVWYDISEHDVTIPLSENADDLQFELNFSDPDSYSGTGTTFNDISGNNVTITSSNVSDSDFDIDNGGYFNVQQSSEAWIFSHSNDLHVTTTNGFTYEFWLYFDTAGNDTFQWFVKGTVSNHDAYFYLHEGIGWYFQFGGLSNFIHNADKLQNQWVHVTFTLSSNVNPTQKLYINGELKKTVNSTGTVSSTSSRDFEIGSPANNANDLYGRLGCVRLYNTELSASEVGQNYRHGRDYIYTALAGTPFLHYDPANSSSYSGTGTTLTDLAGNNNADLLGGIESSYDEELGNSFDITGSGDGITTSSAVSINPANGMTIEMWFKIDSDTQNYLFSFDGTGTTGYGLSYRSTTNQVAFFYKTGASTNSNIYSPTVTVNKWHHLVATTDGNGAQIYLDGEVGDTTTSNAYSTTYNEDLHFGNMYDLAQNANTQIGQIRFYKGHLTADEVMQNYLYTKNDYPNGHNATGSNVSSADWNSGGYFDITGDEFFYGGSLPSSNSGFTFTTWVNFDSLSTSGGKYDTLFTAYEGTGTSSRRILLYCESNGKLRGYVYPSGSTSNSAGTPNTATISTGTWVMVSLVFDKGNSVKLYIDKTAVTGTTNVTADRPLKYDAFYVANGRTASDSFARPIDGKIAQARWYNRPLSSSEIDALVDAGR